MKRIISLLLTLALCLALAACGNSDGGKTDGSLPDVTSSQQKLDVKCNVFALNGPTGMGMAPLMKKAENGEGRLDYNIAAVPCLEWCRRQPPEERFLASFRHF